MRNLEKFRFSNNSLRRLFSRCSGAFLRNPRLCSYSAYEPAMGGEKKRISFFWRKIPLLSAKHKVRRGTGNVPSRIVFCLTTLGLLCWFIIFDESIIVRQFKISVYQASIGHISSTSDGFGEASEEAFEAEGFDFDQNNFVPLHSKIKPLNPGTLVNYRTPKCEYLCLLALEQGYRLHKPSAYSPFAHPPEMLLTSYKKYQIYSPLKHTIISRVGRGSDCIGGGKGRQLACSQFLAQENGCDFDDLKIQPPQWNIQDPEICNNFFRTAAETYPEDTIWIAKPGISYHGKGITIHDDLFEMRRKFGNCEKPLVEGVIVQRYIKSPALMDGHKFDFRSYLLIASTDPFIVFYHDGFVRRAAGIYSTDSESLKDPRIQVTNSEKQEKENHFFNFDQLNEILQESYKDDNSKFSPNFMRSKFVPHAMRTSNYLFQTAKRGLYKRRGLSPTPGRFQVFALDWMVDSEANFHLLEANGNPLIAAYPIPDLTPALWTSMIRLEKILHTSPEDLVGSGYEKLSVREGYSFEGWKLVYNQLEVESNEMTYEPCKFNQYAEKDHPLFSYNNYARLD